MHTVYITVHLTQVNRARGKNEVQKQREIEIEVNKRQKI